MRAPVSWLREYVDLPAQVSGRDLGTRLIWAGLEVETVDVVGAELSGPIVVGRVLSFVDEPQRNGKVIRWCRVDVGPYNEQASEPAADGEPPSRGIVCGAHNFAVGDLVVVSLPGAVLPGGFAIAARRTYGHISDGMICAEDELGIGTDHTGILVLRDTDDGVALRPGQDALGVLHVRDEVLDIAITPDLGYCLSIRGLARESAQALGRPFTDPVRLATPAAVADGHPVRLDTPGCALFVALTVTGVDPAAPTPYWMVARLRNSGMRSISLAVDITNYVMLETGQPLHAYDADRLVGPIVVRQAGPGESIVTLDDVTRALDEADMVIADDSGVIGIAGVMGGATTEIGPGTTRVVVEAAHFDAGSIARSSRRHKLSSEASRRFERGVDPGAAYAAAHRVADLLVSLGGGTLAPAETVVGSVAPVPSQTIDASLPARILGTPVSSDLVVRVFESSSIGVERDGDVLTLTPPTWRPDLRDPYDYVEEVGRKIGLEAIEPVIPTAPAGRGLTASQKARRAVTAAVADAGFVEELQFPFVSSSEIDRLGVGADDERRRLVRIANPLADTSPYLRTTLLPGLFAAVARNTSRSQDDLALFELGSVFLGPAGSAPLLPVDTRPSDDDLQAIEDALPDQPRRLAAVVTGAWLPTRWSGSAVAASWLHAVAFAEEAARAVGIRLERRAAEQAPWHPGRCAALLVDGVVVGHAGELHPDVCAAFGLPARTAAAELDLDALVAAAPGPGHFSTLSAFPVAKEDVALVVDADVPAQQVAAALRDGAGALLENVSLFDVYTGEQVGPGRKSLAFGLRFRAHGRTLKEADVAAAKQAAIAQAAARFGAVQRA